LSDLLSLFKEIYTHRNLAFSRRFLPFTLVLVAGVVTGLFNHTWWFSGEVLPGLLILAWAESLIGLFAWGTRLLWFEAARLKKIRQQIAQMDWEGAQHSLAKVYPLVTIAYMIRRHLLQVCLFKEKGLMLEAHEILKTLSVKPLIMTERNLVGLAQAWLFLDVGNYRDAMATFDNINGSNLTDAVEKVRYSLLASHRAEFDNNFKTAKAKLEQALDDAAIDGANKAFVYHNLARLEDAQGNLNTAFGYYDQAWRLLKTSGHFLQTSITASNMILLHARAGDVVKACKLLSEYESLVDVNNPNQLLEFNNCTVKLARQIGDNALLLHAYQSSADKIEPKLTQVVQLNLLVSELRMHFNDCVDFEAHLVKTMRHLLNATNLKLLHQLAAYKEVLGILRQALTILGPRPDLLVYHGWISLQYVQREASLDAQRAEIPASLPSYRDQWLRFKLELIKVKFNLNPLGIPKQHVESLFATLTELKNIWSDKDNPAGEMNGLVLLLDEYVAYSEQLNDNQFKQDFAGLAHTTLEQAETLLQATWQQPAMHEYTAGLAYFWFKIANDKGKSEFWLEKFDSKKLNLNHFALWYRERYKKTKAWLAQ
jgi:hypothetical protein